MKSFYMSFFWILLMSIIGLPAQAAEDSLQPHEILDTKTVRTFFESRELHATSLHLPSTLGPRASVVSEQTSKLTTLSNDLIDQSRKAILKFESEESLQFSVAVFINKLAQMRSVIARLNTALIDYNLSPDAKSDIKKLTDNVEKLSKTLAENTI